MYTYFMEENNLDLDNSIASLERSVERLEKKVIQVTSYKRVFFISLLHGFGTAVGATFIFGIIIASLVQAAKTIDYVPIINNLLNSQAIEAIINNFTQ